MFYANGVPITSIGVTQNDEGVYYWNGRNYCTPLLKDFDTFQPPKGCKKYKNGSHGPLYNGGQYYYQKAIDFAIPQEQVITANKDCEVLATDHNLGSYMLVKIDGLKVFLVHTYKWSYGHIRAGEPICRIAPTSVSGVGPHLHIYAEGKRIKDILLSAKVRKGFAKGTIVETTTDVFLRKAPCKEEDKVIIPKGKLAKILTLVKQDCGHSWQYVTVPDNPVGFREGWVAIEYLKEHPFDGVTDPLRKCVKEKSELEINLDKCQSELTRVTKELQSVKSELNNVTQELRNTQKELGNKNKQLQKCIKEYNKVVEERQKCLSDKKNIEDELKECKSENRKLKDLVNKLTRELEKCNNEVEECRQTQTAFDIVAQKLGEFIKKVKSA